MTKSRIDLRARVSQATGRRRKKPSSPIERAFDDLKRLVSGGADRTRGGQRRQAAAKKTGADRIRSGRQRQAAAKKAARRRGAKTT